MTIAARDINQALADREFSKATILVYRYWYNELCDVYIENSKAIIRDGTEEERQSALQTLYTALEAALTLIHPFMPFITEEMWQKMPRRPGDNTKSIMLARYPTYIPELDDPESETAYETVLECTKAVRSLMSEYALKEDASGKLPRSDDPHNCSSLIFPLAIIQAYDQTTLKTVEDQVTSIRSLSGKGVTNIDVLGPDAARPSGSVAYPVGTAATVFLHVKGRVDIDAEIAKAQKKLEKANASVKKQEKTLSDPGYKEKVSAQVQESDLAKLADAKQEAKSYEETIRQFEQLKIE
jgi:valyl-tRNA synthetase